MKSGRLASAWAFLVRATPLESFTPTEWALFVVRVMGGALSCYWILSLELRDDADQMRSSITLRQTAQLAAKLHSSP